MRAKDMETESCGVASYYMQNSLKLVMFAPLHILRCLVCSKGFCEMKLVLFPGYVFKL